MYMDVVQLATIVPASRQILSVEPSTSSSMSRSARLGFSLALSRTMVVDPIPPVNLRCYSHIRHTTPLSLRATASRVSTMNTVHQFDCEGDENTRPGIFCIFGRALVCRRALDMPAGERRSYPRAASLFRKKYLRELCSATCE